MEKKSFSIRYWVFGGAGAMPKGGMRDLLGSYSTLTDCINRVVERSSVGLLDWWQIYDCTTRMILDSKDPFNEKDLKQIGYIQAE
jgi:hypothetical protein